MGNDSCDRPGRLVTGPTALCANGWPTLAPGIGRAGLTCWMLSVSPGRSLGSPKGCIHHLEIVSILRVNPKHRIWRILPGTPSIQASEGLSLPIPRPGQRRSGADTRCRESLPRFSEGESPLLAFSAVDGDVRAAGVQTSSQPRTAAAQSEEVPSGNVIVILNSSASKSASTAQVRSAAVETGSSRRSSSRTSLMATPPMSPRSRRRIWPTIPASPAFSRTVPSTRHRSRSSPE